MAIDVIQEPQIEYPEVNRPGVRVGVRTGEVAMASAVRVGNYIPNLAHWNDGPNVPEMQWPGETVSSRVSSEERNVRAYAAGYTEELR